MGSPYAQTEPAITASHRASYPVLKRIMDVVLSLVGLVFLLPILALIALLIKLDSSGPILFVQTRIGKNGRPFRIIKFRTMQHQLDDSYHRTFMRAYIKGEISNDTADQTTKDSDNSCPKVNARFSADNQGATERTVFKPFQESQVTRIGRLLRKTSLDELPQLFNVLGGDMSLVGPRPNVTWEVLEYKSWHRERLAALPGITGLAQVKGRSAIDFDTIVRYDIEYIQNQSLWLDLRILVQTVLSVINGQGAH